MKYAVPTFLKWVYSIVVVSTVMPMARVSFEWLGSARDTGVVAGLPYLIALLFMLLALYRIYLVARVPGTLASYPAAGFASILRWLGIVALYFGASAFILKLTLAPIWVLLMTTRINSAPDIVGLDRYLSTVVDIGVLGLFLFELSRVVGFESHD